MLCHGHGVSRLFVKFLWLMLYRRRIVTVRHDIKRTCRSEIWDCANLAAVPEFEVEWSNLKRSVTGTVFVVTATRFQVLPVHMSLYDLTWRSGCSSSSMLCCVRGQSESSQCPLKSSGNFRAQPELPSESRFLSKRLTIFAMKTFIRKLGHSSFAFARLASLAGLLAFISESSYRSRIAYSQGFWTSATPSFYAIRNLCFTPKFGVKHRLRSRVWSPNPWPQPYSVVHRVHAFG